MNLHLEDFLSSEDYSLLKNCKHWSYYIMNEQLQWKKYSSYYIGFAHKGDKLFTIKAKKLVRAEESYLFPIFAPNDGWYVLQNASYDDRVLTNNRAFYIFYSFSSIEDWEDYYLINIKGYTYTIEDDLFEGTKIVRWGNLNDIDPLDLEANELGFFLTYSWNKKWRNRNEMGIGDEISLLFEDNTKLSFTSKDYPARTNGSPYDYFYRFPITQAIVDKLISLEIVAIRIYFANGDAPWTHQCNSEYNNHALSRIRFRKSVQLYEQLGYKAEQEIIDDVPSIIEKCFVYIMIDETNGFYKIGISNNPRYRERTLQSEKPTIKLICAKEYPDRIIAESIESALHKAYGAKHIRGEWFKLEPLDVSNLIKTLS